MFEPKATLPDKPLLSPPTFSAISCEWCSECSRSRNILCCSELARRQVSHVDKVQEEIPGKDTEEGKSLKKRGIVLYFKETVGCLIICISCCLSHAGVVPRYVAGSII